MIYQHINEKITKLIIKCNNQQQFTVRVSFFPWPPQPVVRRRRRRTRQLTSWKRRRRRSAALVVRYWFGNRHISLTQARRLVVKWRRCTRGFSFWKRRWWQCTRRFSFWKRRWRRRPSCRRYQAYRPCPTNSLSNRTAHCRPLLTPRHCTRWFHPRQRQPAHTFSCSVLNFRHYPVFTVIKIETASFRATVCAE